MPGEKVFASGHRKVAKGLGGVGVTARADARAPFDPALFEPQPGLDFGIAHDAVRSVTPEGG
jgi:hypothetical protein